MSSAAATAETCSYHLTYKDSTTDLRKLINFEVSFLWGNKILNTFRLGFTNKSCRLHRTIFSNYLADDMLLPGEWKYAHRINDSQMSTLLSRTGWLNTTGKLSNLFELPQLLHPCIESNKFSLLKNLALRPIINPVVMLSSKKKSKLKPRGDFEKLIVFNAELKSYCVWLGDSQIVNSNQTVEGKSDEEDFIVKGEEPWLLCLSQLQNIIINKITIKNLSIKKNVQQNIYISKFPKLINLMLCAHLINVMAIPKHYLGRLYYDQKKRLVKPLKHYNLLSDDWRGCKYSQNAGLAQLRWLHEYLTNLAQPGSSQATQAKKADYWKSWDASESPELIFKQPLFPP
ncbi:hypothetical protein VP01_5395g2 [Puccinia sorghi]|uniref:Uncharacterized protein n=1 Tax=Puccinia sorghi TaxID=27349 RepID=A0A0L6UJU3_9BASI|nr:hypothetical protein VP01_5395g2 [Puccinia sorghi]